MSAPSRVLLAAGVVMSLVVACDSGEESFTFDTRPPGSDTAPDSSAGRGPSASTAPPPLGQSTVPSESAEVVVTIDPTSRQGTISPFILGVSSTLSGEEMHDAGITLNSFGGNPATRYNYEIGHAWNHGADYEFRNTNYGQTSGSAARDIITTNQDAAVQTRLAVPTLGWIARDDRDSTCSFPQGDGVCLAASDVGSCEEGGPVADPTTANVESTPEGVRTWVQGLVADGLAPDIIAMDNEPELWGSTHYDVHPECPTFEEILDKYLTYATAIREVAPDARLAGPVVCCWYDYWDTAPGPADGPDEDYLSWFLRNVKEHDDATGTRTLDMVDVHFYPQSDVFNDESDDETNARRLRSTRSLWDPEYEDESWIDATIRFLPRMGEIIEQSYPGTPLLVSEWNFGAEETMNGALAIAEAIGIFGREGVEAATYWRHPDVGSAGWFAFKMHGNYDDDGSRFGGDAVAATTSDTDRVSAFAAVDDAAGVLRVMLLNKDAENALTVTLSGLPASSDATRFTYSADNAAGIVSDTMDPAAPVALAPYSITLLEIPLT